MRLPQLRMVQIFVEESITLFSEIKEARALDSDGGRMITRAEVFPIVLGFILRLGEKLETSILGDNALPSGHSIKWELLRIVFESRRSA